MVKVKWTYVVQSQRIVGSTRSPRRVEKGRQRERKNILFHLRQENE